MEIIDILNLTPEITRQYQTFKRIVSQVADLHQLYLQEEGLDITDCYTLELSNVKARIEINPGVPSDMYEQLHQCFKRSFG